MEPFVHDERETNQLFQQCWEACFGLAMRRTTNCAPDDATARDRREVSSGLNAVGRHPARNTSSGASFGATAPWTAYAQPEGSRPIKDRATGLSGPIDWMTASCPAFLETICEMASIGAYSNSSMMACPKHSTLSRIGCGGVCLMPRHDLMMQDVRSARLAELPLLYFPTRAPPRMKLSPTGRKRVRFSEVPERVAELVPAPIERFAEGKLLAALSKAPTRVTKIAGPLI